MMGRHEPNVYFLRPVGQAGPVKIGWSWLPLERLKVYQAWSPVQLELVARTPGSEGLESRFHAHFAHLHLHGEWFRADDGLDAMIAAILDGSFTEAALPAGRRLHKKIVRPEAVEAGRMTRRLSDLRVLGVPMPEEVCEAQRTYGFEPDEVARRRAVVRAFVMAHEHLREAAVAAATALRRRQALRWAEHKAAIDPEKPSSKPQERAA